MTPAAEDHSLIVAGDCSITFPSVEWTIVSRRRRRGRNRCPLPPPSPTSTSDVPSPWTPADSSIDSARVSNLLDLIRSTSNRLERSKFHRRFLSCLRSSPVQSALSEAGLLCQLVVYGLGSIESYDTPRLQLSLALLLKRELGAAAVEVFDPVLSATECAVLEALGLSVIRVDERCRREARRPTLFYMPHCDVDLYDNLLRANWVPSRLNQMVILGNSFGAYARNMNFGYQSRDLEARARHVLAVRKHVLEIGIEDVDPWVDGGLEHDDDDDGLCRAFQDTSWHFFNLHAVADMNSLLAL